MLNSKKQKKINYNSRKKAIFADKKIPLQSPKKLVWVINTQGSAFIQVSQNLKYEGDPQIRMLMDKKIIPELNKNIGKLWLKDQEQTFKSIIFPNINTFVKILLLILALTFMIAFLSIHSTLNIFNQILITSIYCIWLFCVVIVGYTFTKKYQRIDYDQKIVARIKQTLCRCNNTVLKHQGYIAKCDEWGIWISVSGGNKLPNQDIYEILA